MAYAQIRIRRISMSDIDSTEKHNARHYAIDEYPENIDPKKSVLNRIEFNQEDWKKRSLKEIILQREIEIGIKAIKSNSTHALEVVLSVSEKVFFEKYESSGYMMNEWKWLEEKFGEDNVLAAYIHKDESKIHVHYIVLPVKEKDVKYKNRYGEGVRKEWRLAASDYVDGKEKMEEWQQIYFEHCRDRYGHIMEFWRGTKAEEQKRKYTQETDHILGKIRSEIKYALELQDLEKVDKLAKLLEKESIKRIEKIQELNETIESQKRSRRPERGYDWAKSWKLAEPGWKKEKPKKEKSKRSRR